MRGENYTSTNTILFRSVIGEPQFGKYTFSKVIESIVNERLPLGLKKMLLFINTKYSIALDPRNVNSARLIQESRKQWYMDEVIPLLGESCPPEGEIGEKDEKQKLTKNVVFTLLKELRKNSKQL